MNKYFITPSLLLLFALQLHAQDKYELNAGWLCSPATKIKQPGTEISRTYFSLTGWIPATVPGTVLTTMHNNKQVPDPFYGMNNKYIPDIMKPAKNIIPIGL